MELQELFEVAQTQDAGADADALRRWLEILADGGPPWLEHLVALGFHRLGVRPKALRHFALACEHCPEVALLHGVDPQSIAGGDGVGVNFQAYLDAAGGSCARATVAYHAAHEFLTAGDGTQGLELLSLAAELAPGAPRVAQRLAELGPGLVHGGLEALNRMECAVMRGYSEDAPLARAMAPLRRLADRDALERARAALTRAPVRVLLLIYDQTRDLLAESFEPERFAVTQVPDVDAAVAELERGEYDFFLTTNIYMERPENLLKFLSAGKNPDAVHAVWLTDLHHSHMQSLRLARAFDFCVPAHERNTDCLRLVSANITSAVPMAVQQFSFEQARRLYDANETRPRAAGLYGGFRQHAGFSRNDFITEIAAAIPGNALYLRPSTTPYDQDAYFCLSADEKFLDWMGHKVTLHVPIHRDLSPRVYDALLAGQIPLVPPDISAFDQFFSPAEQARLPIVRYTDYTVDAVAEAYRRALAMWDAGGAAGARARHEWCLQSGMLARRLRRMVDAVAVFAGCHADGYEPRSES